MLKDKIRNIYGQKSLIRFGVVGGLNTLIDFGVFLVLYYALSVPLVGAHVAAFCVANVNSYLLNKFWTFGDLSPHSPAQISRFLIVSIGGLGLSSLTIFLCAQIIPVVAAKIIAFAVSFAWNYWGNRVFVFIQGETRR